MLGWLFDFFFICEGRSQALFLGGLNEALLFLFSSYITFVVCLTAACLSSKIKIILMAVMITFCRKHCKTYLLHDVCFIFLITFIYIPTFFHRTQGGVHLGTYKVPKQSSQTQTCLASTSNLQHDVPSDPALRLACY